MATETKLKKTLERLIDQLGELDTRVGDAGTIEADLDPTALSRLLDRGTAFLSTPRPEILADGIEGVRAFIAEGRTVAQAISDIAPLAGDVGQLGDATVDSLQLSQKIAKALFLNDLIDAAPPNFKRLAKDIEADLRELAGEGDILKLEDRAATILDKLEARLDRFAADGVLSTGEEAKLDKALAKTIERFDKLGNPLSELAAFTQAFDQVNPLDGPELLGSLTDDLERQLADLVQDGEATDDIASDSDSESATGSNTTVRASSESSSSSGSPPSDDLDAVILAGPLIPPIG